MPYLLYVPEPAGRSVDVVDPTTLKVIGSYVTGLDPQHIVPSYDLRTLWSTNDLANTVTPFDPRTGRPAGPAIAVNDPYNMYFPPGGRQAMGVQEQLQQLGFYDAHTMAPLQVVKVDCPVVDHAGFSAVRRTDLTGPAQAGRYTNSSRHPGNRETPYRWERLMAWSCSWPLNTTRSPRSAIGPACKSSPN